MYEKKNFEKRDRRPFNRNRNKSMIPLRDYYANTALQHFLNSNSPLSNEEIASKAFEMSDAMLKERRESYLRNRDKQEE